MLYLDPGTGTLIWQLIAASALSGLFYLRASIQKLINLVFRKKNAP